MTLHMEDPIIGSYVDSSAVIHYWQVPGGRFALVTGSNQPVGGDPTRSGDESRSVASRFLPTTGPDDFPYFYLTSKQTIAVGGVYYDVHNLAANAGDVTGSTPVEDFWPVPLVAGSRDFYGIAHIPLDDPNPNVATEFIEITHNLALIHDAVRVDYIIRNNSTGPLPIGMRVLIDGRFGGLAALDGRPVVLPSGRVISTEAKLPDADTTTVPETWLMFDNPEDPNVIVRGTLEGSEVHDAGMANESAGLPDEVAFGLYRSMGTDMQWDFTPNKALPLTGEDWAYSVRWSEKDLAAGRSRRYVTYYGIGNSTVDFDPPYALAGYSPATLVAKPGDDPTTPVVETYYLTDRQGRSPFPVYAYADNFYAAPLIDASVRISLPTGLELDPDTQPRSKSLGIVGRNQLASVGWTVRATAARPGVAVIKFTGPYGKTVERKVNIPALPVLTPLPSAIGLEMVSIPYEFSNSDAEHVLQSLGGLHVGGPNALIRWDPFVQVYRWFPDPHVTNIHAGAGYWLLNRNRLTVYFPTDATELPRDRAHAVNVKAGWNQIGNPFTAPLYFDKVRVIGPTAVEWSMREAVDRGLLLPTLFSYDAEHNEYDWEVELAQTRMDPYFAYWFYCQDDVTLLFPPPNLFAPASASDEGLAAVADGGWKAGLTVSSSGRTRTNRCFGMSPMAEDGVDSSDVLAPPACLPDGVVLTAEMVQPARGARFMQDIRRAGSGPEEWMLEVSTSASEQPVTISWPDLSSMPSDLVAVFEDVATSQRRYMRTSAGYTYRSLSGGGTRWFKIVVQPRATQQTLVTSASVHASGGGASIVYSVATDASVGIEVRNISGVLVRRVASDKVVAAGVNTQAWDGRNTAGSRVPAGRYLARITARSPETGQQHSMVRTFQLSR